MDEKENQDSAPTSIPLELYLGIRPWAATLVILASTITSSPDLTTFALWLPAVGLTAIIMGFSWACIASKAGRFNGTMICEICGLASSVIVFVVIGIVSITLRSWFSHL